jgi:N-acetylglucosaminyldiphosphoundecaprenol N-acetyl-beta-D-mannosaminyltransferase
MAGDGGGDVAVRRLFGIDFLDAPSIGAVSEKLLADADRRCAALRSVVTPNVDHLVRYSKYPDERCAAQAAYIALADGMPIVWASRLLRKPLSRRLTGADLFADLWPRLISQDRSVLVVVGNEEMVAMLAAEHPSATFIVPQQFDAADRATLEAVANDIVARISESPVDFVIMGIAMPKTHRIVPLLQQRRLPGGHAPIVLMIGAAAEFHTGHQRRAPEWMQRSGVEWVHRLVSRPGYMAKRYLIDDMKFVVLVWREWRHR